jgi:hypothetical protein
VKAVFVELPPFERYRADYLDDDAFLRLQQLLMLNPAAGALIPGTGGLRKLRYSDERRGKGKRGGFAGDLLLVGCRLTVLVVHNLRQR